MAINLWPPVTVISETMLLPIIRCDGSLFQLRLTVAEAMGSMCHLMAGEKLEEQIPKLIPAILSLYKKNNEHYIISKVGTDKLFVWAL